MPASAVVVGAGAFGAALARALARAGWAVTLVEADAPGHALAASGGESRLLRCAHGPARWYVRSARRATALWRELQAETGRALFEQIGVVWFARRDDGWEAESERVLRAEGVPVERLEVRDAARLFPSFRGDDLAWALLEPEAGVLRAAAATRALADSAAAAGARLLRARARPAPDGTAVVAGRPLPADRTVWACGAWLPALFGEPVPIRTRRQDVVHFAAPPAWRTPPVPGWVDYDGAAYGLGDLDGLGMKACSDVEGPPWRPDAPPAPPPPEAEARARAYLRLRFPALGDAPPLSSRPCPYALTPDTHFLLAPLPGADDVWLLGGGSGHGFKHAPALAEVALAALTGAQAPPPAFGFGPRAPDLRLRTAGSA